MAITMTFFGTAFVIWVMQTWAITNLIILMGLYCLNTAVAIQMWVRSITNTDDSENKRELWETRGTTFAYFALLISWLWINLH